MILTTASHSTSHLTTPSNLNFTSPLSPNLPRDLGPHFTSICLPKYQSDRIFHNNDALQPNLEKLRLAHLERAADSSYSL